MAKIKRPAFGGIRNGHSVQQPQPQKRTTEVHVDSLADIPEDEWPNARAQFVAQKLPGHFMNAPAYQNTHPVVMPRVNQAGQTMGVQLLPGLRKREYIAVEFIGAAIAARIRQAGVIGHNDPIPLDPAEQRNMVAAAMSLANLVLRISVDQEIEDTNELKDLIGNQLDTKRAAELQERATPLTADTPSIENPDPNPAVTDTPKVTTRIIGED